MSNYANTGFPVSRPYIGVNAGVILCSNNMEFATVAAAKVEANWDAMFKEADPNQRAYPILEAFKDGGTQDEPVYEVGLQGKQEKMYQKSGTIEYTWTNPTAELRKNLKKFDGKEMYCYKVFSNNLFEGRKDAATGLKVQAIKCDVKVKYSKTVGDTEQPKVTIEIQEKSPETYMTLGVEVEPSFTLTDKEGLKDVVITSVSDSANDVVFTVADKLEGNAISGLVVGDVYLNGAVLAAATLTESATIPGRYTFAKTSAFANADVVSLAPANVLSLLIEGTNSLTLTLP